MMVMSNAGFNLPISWRKSISSCYTFLDSRFRGNDNNLLLLFVSSYTFFRAMQPIFMVKRSTFLCFTYLLNYFRIIQL